MTKQEQAAIKSHGTTTDPESTVFITTAGLWIDGSGQHQGMFGVGRSIAHEEIAIASLGETTLKGSEAVAEYQRLTNNIRIKYLKDLHIDLVKFPTDEQIISLARLARGKAVVVDLLDKEGVMQFGHFDNMGKARQFIDKHLL